MRNTMSFADKIINIIIAALVFIGVFVVVESEYFKYIFPNASWGNLSYGYIKVRQSIIGAALCATLFAGLLLWNTFSYDRDKADMYRLFTMRCAAAGFIIGALFMKYVAL